MTNWSDLTTQQQKFNQEVRPRNFIHEKREESIRELSNLTGRNTIVYFSGWQQKNQADFPPDTFSINSKDKHAFMTAIHNLDKSQGLDLVLHTPGGDVAATESIVNYLKAVFAKDIRVIVPEIAMSCGTIIALSSKSIVMGNHSSLGPIDPQFNGLPAHGLIEEFSQAKKDVAENPANAGVWNPILMKYGPTLLGEADKAIKWSRDISINWLVDNMFSEDEDPAGKASRVVDELADHATTLAHNRQISLEKSIFLGLSIEKLEDDPTLQDAVLTLHHTCVMSCQQEPSLKMVFNQRGTGVYFNSAPT